MNINSTILPDFENHLSNRDFERLIKNQLSDLEKIDLKKHLSTCEMCSDILEGYIIYDNEDGIDKVSDNLYQNFYKKNIKSKKSKPKFLNLSQQTLSTILAAFILLLCLSILAYLVFFNKNKKSNDNNNMNSIDSLEAMSFRENIPDPIDVDTLHDVNSSNFILEDFIAENQINLYNDEPSDDLPIDLNKSNESTQDIISQYLPDFNRGNSEPINWNSSKQSITKYPSRKKIIPKSYPNYNIPSQNSNTQIIYNDPIPPSNSNELLTGNFIDQNPDNAENSSLKYIKNNSPILDEVVRMLDARDFDRVVSLLENNKDLNIYKNYYYRYALAYSYLSTNNKNKAKSYIFNLAATPNPYQNWAKAMADKFY